MGFVRGVKLSVLQCFIKKAVATAIKNYRLSSYCLVLVKKRLFTEKTLIKSLINFPTS